MDRFGAYDADGLTVQRMQRISAIAVSKRQCCAIHRQQHVSLQANGVLTNVTFSDDAAPSSGEMDNMNSNPVLINVTLKFSERCAQSNS